VKHGRRDGARLPAGRYLEVRYEDLVAEPQAALGIVCEFLDEAFDERMLEYPRVAAERLPPRTTEPGQLHERTVLPPSLPDDRFSSLAPDVRAAVEYVCKPVLQSLGYDVVPNDSVRARVGAHLGWIRAAPTRALDLLEAVVHQRGREL
jgi:hypothetical protein